MTYCFVCPRCGRTETRDKRTPYRCPDCDGVVMIRDYRAEAVNVIPPKT